MEATLRLIDTLVNLYILCLVAAVVMSWLVNFDILNRQSNFVARASEFLTRVTEPILNPIRRVIPNIAGVDISPVIAILAINYLRDLMFEHLL